MQKSKNTNLLSHALYGVLCVVRLMLMAGTVGLIALIVSPLFYLLGVKKPFESFFPAFERLSFNIGHNVVGRSEQLVCVHPYENVYQSETECYCEKCGEDLTQSS